VVSNDVTGMIHGLPPRSGARRSLSAAVFACSSGPTPSLPEPKLTADDFEVLAAVVNDTIRKPREAYRDRLKERGLRVNSPRPLLVADQTLRTCEIHDNDPRRCVDRTLMKCLAPYPLALQDRSRQSYVIGAAFAPDILIVDTEYFFTLLRQLGAGRLSEGLQRRYPRSQSVDVAFFSVPLYPRPREAVVLMRHYFNGAPCLLLRLNTDGWSVERPLGGWVE
jgi:hypothetical protein